MREVGYTLHAYQLDPVIRALSMPRVSLLLADGVGLGKTIQAGLVLEELLLRRRIRRILVLCPAMLQRQWRMELRRKFNLDFEVIDSDSTFQLRLRMGIDTNPWKAFPRIITSMDYLRMPDVLQQFLQASGAGPDADASDQRFTAHAPWDLLIVDECHHFAPQGGGRASQRTKMLREIRFLFEHRVFASATPHNWIVWHVIELRTKSANGYRLLACLTSLTNYGLAKVIDVEEAVWGDEAERGLSNRLNVLLHRTKKMLKDAGIPWTLHGCHTGYVELAPLPADNSTSEIADAAGPAIDSDG